MRFASRRAVRFRSEHDKPRSVRRPGGVFVSGRRGPQGVPRGATSGDESERSGIFEHVERIERRSGFAAVGRTLTVVRRGPLRRFLCRTRIGRPTEGFPQRPVQQNERRIVDRLDLEDANEGDRHAVTDAVTLNREAFACGIERPALHPERRRIHRTRLARGFEHVSPVVADLTRNGCQPRARELFEYGAVFGRGLHRRLRGGNGRRFGVRLVIEGASRKKGRRENRRGEKEEGVASEERALAGRAV